MAVCALGSPRLHACSCKVLAFLRDISNRVIITGRYLRRGSDPMVSEAKRYSDVHDVSTIVRKKPGEKTKEMCPDITYVAGSSWSVGYGGFSKP